MTCGLSRWPLAPPPGCSEAPPPCSASPSTAAVAGPAVVGSVGEEPELQDGCPHWTWREEV